MSISDIQLMIFNLNGRTAKSKSEIMNDKKQGKQINPLDVRYLNNLINAVKCLRACRDYEEKINEK